MPQEDDKFCCVNCFSEAPIREFVEWNKTVGRCDYCGSGGVYIRNAEDVGEFVRDGFLRKYEDAAESVGYCSAEGGYLLPTYTIDEILIEIEEIFGDALEDPSNLVEDLVHPDLTPYVRKDPYGPEEPGIESINSWDDFCKFVKSQRRFTALMSTEDQPFGEENHSDFLDQLAARLNDRLLTELGPGAKIYRARLEQKETIFGHKDLTSPPLEKTRNNRMSPAGISLFYGGLDIDTCISEVRPNVGEKVVVGEFETLKQLKVLDLSAREVEKELLSIFDENYSFEYEEYFKPFINYFARDISKPIRPDDAAIDYTPTQVFTEFMRIRKFRDLIEVITNNTGETYTINGLLYSSFLNKDGVNIVLFRGPDISIDQPGQDPSAWLLYQGYSTYEIKELKLTYEKLN
jgi:hypothetical protein